MSHSSMQGLLSALTTTKGALLAAPAVIGVGLLLSLSGPSNGSAGSTGIAPAKQAVPVPASASSATAPLIKVASTETDKAEKSKGTFSASQREEIGQIVRDYLLKNPEILQEVSEELGKRRAAAQAKARVKILADSKEEIFRSPLDFALGDKDSDITIVEYFDYNCGWCKRALNEVTKLTDADSKIRVVMKEFPIFGEHSEFAAKAAMAAKAQGKYWDFHVAMMKERRVTKDNVLTIAKRVGLDAEQLKVEMQKPKYEAAIRKTQQIATSLGIEGTPGFIIDSRVNPGFVPAEQLRSMVADIRKKGCKFC